MCALAHSFVAILRLKSEECKTYRDSTIASHRPSKKGCLITRRFVFNLRETRYVLLCGEAWEKPKNLMRTKAFWIALKGD